jgi:transposase
MLSVSHNPTGSEATSMDDTTSLLFGLDSFRVVDVVRVADQVVQVVVETVEPQGFCPECGVGSTKVKDRSLVRIRDLPVADAQVALWWRKRRLVCQKPSCPRRSFTPITTDIPARSPADGPAAAAAG